MPRGPKGEKRPADVIGAAVMVGKIATGEIEGKPPADDGKNPAAVALGRMGGKARALGSHASMHGKAVVTMGLGDLCRAVCAWTMYL